MPSLTPPEEKTVIDFASDYLKRGWQPLPIPLRSKNPNFEGWQNLVLNESDLPNHFNNDKQNIGVLLGEKSNGLTDIDLDTKEAVQLADHFLPKTKAVFGRNGSARSHRLYLSELPKIEKFEYGGTIVEIRSTGGQTVFPPSIHKETGEKIEWFEDGEPLRIEADKLRRSVAMLACACVLLKVWKYGIRHNLTLSVCGAMLRNGYSINETKTLIGGICYVTNDEETNDRLKCVDTTAENLKNNQNVVGLPTLANLTEKKLADKISDWLGFSDLSGYSQAVNNSTPKIEFTEKPKDLDVVLKHVDELDLDCLPDVLVNWLIPASKIIGCPIDFLALSSIVTAGSLIGSRIRIKPLQNSDWFVVPNLYAGVIGFPSTKKTPALDEIRKPVLELQHQSRKDFDIAKSDYEIEEKFYDKQSKQLFNKFKGNDVASFKLQLAGLDKPTEPKLRRFETNDVTASKLIQLLSDNPNGFLLFRDELTGWLKSLDAEYDKSARSFFLELWKGGIFYELARVDGREIHLTSGTLSIIGGIQPSKLQRYVSEAYSFDNADGFLQRFLFAYPDVTQSTSQMITENDYQSMKTGFNNANRIFKELALKDFHGKCITQSDDVFRAIKFSSNAQKIADKWKEAIEKEAGSLQFEDEPFSSYLYKMPKNCFAVCLIFHCLENIDASSFPDEISETTALKAFAYVDVLISHARRVFGLGEKQIFSLASSLLGKIKKGKLEQGFTQYDLKRKQWSGLKSYEDIKDVLRLLSDYGYLIESKKQTNGKNTIGYYFHPELEINKK